MEIAQKQGGPYTKNEQDERRNKVYSMYFEKGFSAIKRKFGSEIRSYHDIMKEKELLYRVLAYNCHRMTMISALLWMISREPKLFNSRPKCV